MKKRILSLLLALVMTAGCVISASAAGKSTVALGADLSEDQKATVLSLLGVTDLNSYDVVYVTNDDEKKALGNYFSADKIGTKSLSSVLITETEPGSGINVTTYNINTCTVQMYTNALETAGVKDANIVVAAPTPISGTSALVGVSKAYGEITGSSIDKNLLDAAINEIAVTGSITSVDPDDAAVLIAQIKDELKRGGYTDAESISGLIDELSVQYGFTLTASEKQQIIDLCLKLLKADQVQSSVGSVVGKVGGFFSGLFGKLFKK
ncbi:MAG: DUF1002 domain-containing protein [Lachnospiraceae bacterium]|nr:DUF1002 domain-containing protein [Lachnospiraceae bacterium]